MLNLSDVFNSASVAMNRTEVESNRIPYLGEAYFPSRKKMGLDLKWIKIHKGLGVALKPSTFDAIPTVRPRGGAKLTQEEMPFFRESMIIKEKDMMELARIQDSNDPYLQPVIDSIYDDTNTLIDGADIAVEKMRMQLLAPTDGDLKITIGAADNTSYIYDYDADNKWSEKHFTSNLSGATWDNPTTAKPLTDIRKGIQYLASIGYTGATILGNSTTFDYLLDCDQVKNALVSITGQTIGFLDTETVEEVLRRKLKIDWLSYDKMYTDYDGVEKKFYPDNYVTIIGNGQLGNTWYGTTPEELTMMNFMGMPQPPVDISVLDRGVAVAVKSEYKPAHTVTTTASQIVLPSFEGMDGIYVIKVKS